VSKPPSGGRAGWRLLQNGSVLMSSKDPARAAKSSPQRHPRHRAQRAVRRSSTATSLPLSDRMWASGNAHRRLSLRMTNKERHSDPLHRVHRHDGRQLPMGLSSSTVAVALRQTRAPRPASGSLAQRTKQNGGPRGARLALPARSATRGRRAPPHGRGSDRVVAEFASDAMARPSSWVASPNCCR
jgi:hypothetical protein